MRAFRSSSTSPSASSASATTRLAALAAVALGLLAAGAIALSRGGEGMTAARLAPPDALLWVRVSTARDDEQTARLWAIARAVPSLQALQDALIGPGVDPDREIRPWLGDELALALTSPGRPLLLAAVADRPAAERFLGRRRDWPEGVVSAFAGDFVALGPEAEVRAAQERAAGRAPALAVDDELDGTLEAYAPAAGVRRLLEDAPEALRAAAAFADAPQFEALAAAATPEQGGLRISARVHRASGGPPAREFVPALAGRAPAGAAAYVALPGAQALADLLGGTGAGPVLDGLRRALPELAGLDLDRDVLAPLGTEAALTVDAAGAAPVITLTARTSDAALTREALARLQAPLAAVLGTGTGAFEARDGGAFSLPVTAALQPSYAVTGDVVVASTAESGLEQMRVAPRGVALEPALRSVSDRAGGRVEALAFADLRQLLSLGERTGLTSGPAVPALREDLRVVRAAGAVAWREESDSTAEIFLEIP